MPSLTIRNLDETIKERLRVRAATHGHSMEEEARLILRQAVCGVTGRDLWTRSRTYFEGNKGVALDLPDRSEDRSSPRFDGTDTAA